MGWFFQRLRTAGQLLGPGECTLHVDQLPVRFRHLSRSRRMNLLRLGLKAACPRLPLTTQPYILQVEPSNACQLHCPTCPRGADLLTRPTDQLSPALFRQLIDETRDFASVVFFWSWGEPFLHPDLCEMIRYAADAGFYTHASTNGHAFGADGAASALVASGLHTLIVAVDGLDQHTYETYRVGGDLATVREALLAIRAARETAGGTTPFVDMRFVVMPHNEHQVDAVAGYGRELGADAVTLRAACAVQGDAETRFDLSPDQEAYRHHRDGGRSRRCRRPYANLSVFSNGDVVLCENDFNATHPLGNLHETTVSDLLDSAAYREALARFGADPDGFPFCETCGLRDGQHASFNVNTTFFNPHPVI